MIQRNFYVYMYNEMKTKTDKTKTTKNVLGTTKLSDYTEKQLRCIFCDLRYDFAYFSIETQVVGTH